MQVLKPQGGLPKDVMVNFLGDLTSHRLRQEMATALIKEPGFMVGKVCPGDIDTHHRASSDQATAAAIKGQVAVMALNVLQHHARTVRRMIDAIRRSTRTRFISSSDPTSR